jgi:hypothetical protein
VSMTMPNETGHLSLRIPLIELLFKRTTPKKSKD